MNYEIILLLDTIAGTMNPDDFTDVYETLQRYYPGEVALWDNNNGVKINREADRAQEPTLVITCLCADAKTQKGCQGHIRANGQMDAELCARL